MKGGRGSLTAGRTDWVHFWVSSLRLAFSVLDTRSRLRETRTQQLEETVLRAAGVGARPGAARGQLANWIRERGGERHRRAGGARPRGPGRGAKEPAAVPTVAAQPLSITRREPAFGRARAPPPRAEEPAPFATPPCPGSLGPRHLPEAASFLARGGAGARLWGDSLGRGTPPAAGQGWAGSGRGSRTWWATGPLELERARG